MIVDALTLKAATGVIASEVCNAASVPENAGRIVAVDGTAVMALRGEPQAATEIPIKAAGMMSRRWDCMVPPRDMTKTGGFRYGVRQRLGRSRLWTAICRQTGQRPPAIVQRGDVLYNESP